MADLADVAADLIEESELAGVAAVRAKLPTGASAVWCECGAVIPQKRRQLLPGIQTCVLCAEISERRQGVIR